MRRRGTTRRTHDLLVAALLCAALPTTVHAAQTVRLDATLTPERLGHGTTIGFGFQITAPAGRVPPPLTRVEVRYPSDLGIALSGLGLATCTPSTLEAFGPAGCSADSRMGYGTALAEIPIGPEIIHETAHLTLLRAPTQNGRLALLFYAEGTAPVNTQIFLPGLLLPAPAPFGGRIDIKVPLVPSLPEAPAVAVVKLRSTIGPEHLTYYEHLHRRWVGYRPKGILLPDNCPPGGFPFAATLTFLDGTHASAQTTVPCPAKKKDSLPTSNIEYSGVLPGESPRGSWRPDFIRGWADGKEQAVSTGGARAGCALVLEHREEYSSMWAAVS